MEPYGPITILVVEDDEAVRRLSLSLLRSLGYRTLEAFDGKSGLATFMRHEDQIDLTLTDVAMPHSGPEMVDQILRVDPEARIMFMSGTASPEELPAHLKRFPLLQKPFTYEALARGIRRCLDGLG